jgi:hypothetical protein
VSYAEFLARKRIRAEPCGIDVPSVDDGLFEFQQHLTLRALARGRSAIFAGCGLGKSAMAIEWANRVSEHTGKMVLILTPLAVAPQFVREGQRMGVSVVHSREPGDVVVNARIVVTNYERLEKFLPLIPFLGGVVLDESSILKNFDGKTRTALIDAFQQTPFRLCCTATPAPNDFEELGNHAEFLGIMRRVDMLNRFFEHDAGDTGTWVLKGHGRRPFWQWVASWASCGAKPSDFGRYSDEGYELPPITIHDHVVDVDGKMANQAGLLFSYEAASLSEQRAVRKASMLERVDIGSRLANDSADQWIVWAELNDESKALAKAIAGAVEVSGSDSAEEKESAILRFINGDARVLVTKTSIAGFGLNLQNCACQLFIGASHSHESIYQAIRRSYRFGQKRPVDIHNVRTSADGRIAFNAARKAEEHETMIREIAKVNHG